MKATTSITSALQTLPIPAQVLILFVAYFALLFISTKFIMFIVRRSRR